MAESTCITLHKGDVEIASGIPAIFVKSIGAVVIADLHIGYEWALGQQDIHLPLSQFPEMLDDIKRLIETYDPDILIIDGDLKHEFSKATAQEWREVLDLLHFLDKNIRKTYVVRGNHDNFIRGFFRRYEHVDFVEPYLLLEDYMFLHGDKEILDINSRKDEYEVLVIGHEHPSMIIVDEVGARVRLKVLMTGPMKIGRELIVLPAFSPIMSGVEVVTIRVGAGGFALPQSQFLSPILRNYTEIGEMRVIGIDKEGGVLPFPKIADLL